MWTGQVKHFDNTTINRVKSAHGRLKIWLGDNMSGFCKGWETISNMIVLHHNEIHTFGKSITILEHKFQDES